MVPSNRSVKAAAGGAFQAGGHLPEADWTLRGVAKLGAVLALPRATAGVLHSAVGVQEVTAQVGDGRGPSSSMTIRGSSVTTATW